MHSSVSHLTYALLLVTHIMPTLLPWYNYEFLCPPGPPLQCFPAKNAHTAWRLRIELNDQSDQVSGRFLMEIVSVLPIDPSAALSSLGIVSAGTSLTWNAVNHTLLRISSSISGSGQSRLTLKAPEESIVVKEHDIGCDEK